MTTYAPQSIQSGSFRGELFKIFLRKLHDLVNHANIQAVLIGPEFQHNFNERVHVVTSNLPSKETKLSFIHDWILNREMKFDYICRLDDDDFLNANAINLIDQRWDFITDRAHMFYDIASGMVSSQMRPWFPNTSLMKWKHAFAKPWDSEKSLMFHYNHAKFWHLYAKQQNLKILQTNQPVYVRVISPFSITSTKKKDGKVLASGIIWKKYFQYRNGFGTWQHSSPDLDWAPIEDLKLLWVKNFGSFKSPNLYDKIWILLVFLIDTIGNKSRRLGNATLKILPGFDF